MPTRTWRRDRSSGTPCRLLSTAVRHPVPEANSWARATCARRAVEAREWRRPGGLVRPGARAAGYQLPRAQVFAHQLAGAVEATLDCGWREPQLARDLSDGQPFEVS